MSEELRILSTRYQNKLFLTDDYGEFIVFYTNYKVSVIEEWIHKFKYSKYCKIERQKTHFIGKLGKFKGKKIKTEKYDYKFSLDLFMRYLDERKYDYFYLRRDQYEELNPRKKRFIKIKRKRNGYS